MSAFLVWGRRRGSNSSPPTSREHKQLKSAQKKKVSQLSNEEIRAANTRKQLEKQYKDMNPSKIAQGQKVVKNILGAIGAATLAATTIITAVETGKKVYAQITPLIKK